MAMTLPRREAVLQHHTWNIESIFATSDDWEQAYRLVDEELPGLSQFRGRLAESPAMLLRWLHTKEQLQQSVDHIEVYAQLLFDSDTTNQMSAALMSRAQGLKARFSTATAFAEPELLALDMATIEQAMAAEPDLQMYQHFFHNLLRCKDHVRSAEVEDVIAQAGESLETPGNVYQMLADSDLVFGIVKDSDGQEYQVAQGTIDDLLLSPDRMLRKAAWETFADGFLSIKNTLSALIEGYVKTSVFRSRVRRYPSAHVASLAEYNIPVEVYHNVIDACNRHLGIWHRYWDVRRRVLGLAQLEICDIFAPLNNNPPHVPYEQAVEWICTGMAPLGEEYVQAARAGLTHQRWVDIYPNYGKRGGAYSSGAYGTSPFILMNYSNNMDSLSTLAHELGHSMHSYFSRKHQPYVYSDYSLFVAEVASNFNQALTRAHLLQANPAPDFQIVVIEEAMRNFHRYLFLMPILAQYELYIHERVEKNQALTADDMSNYLLGLLRQGYGAAMRVDEPREGITWAQFPHMYVSFYVYQYASGIAAANMLADQVLQGEPGIVERYLDFLKTGSSLYPLDALKLAGIDMLSPEPMDRAFAVLDGFVDQLDRLIS